MTPNNKQAIRKTMLDFLYRYRGKSVLFVPLSGEDKYIYVLVKGFQYFSKFLPSKEALERSIRNAEAHKRNGYDCYNSPLEHMIIS